MSSRTSYSWIGAGVALFLLISTYSVHHSTTSIPLHTTLSTFISDPSNSLTYRTHLEETTSPNSQIVHSQTLTFDHIYVLSLPTRHDRREQMEQLARAHGLKITFVDAVNKDEPFIRWIAERAVEVRQERLRIMVSTLLSFLEIYRAMADRVERDLGGSSRSFRIFARRSARWQRLARSNSFSRFTHTLPSSY